MKKTFTLTSYAREVAIDNVQPLIGQVVHQRVKDWGNPHMLMAKRTNGVTVMVVEYRSALHSSAIRMQNAEEGCEVDGKSDMDREEN